jgi:hypothetical protein
MEQRHFPCLVGRTVRHTQQNSDNPILPVLDGPSNNHKDLWIINLAHKSSSYTLRNPQNTTQKEKSSDKFCETVYKSVYWSLFIANEKAFKFEHKFQIAIKCVQNGYDKKRFLLTNDVSLNFFNIIDFRLLNWRIFFALPLLNLRIPMMGSTYIRTSANTG